MMENAIGTGRSFWTCGACGAEVLNGIMHFCSSALVAQPAPYIPTLSAFPPPPNKITAQKIVDTIRYGIEKGRDASVKTPKEIQALAAEIFLAMLGNCEL